ncbi:hypothetical protein EBT16_10950 [bacterium]|nr:hypothetical protein [bacterium]
MLNQKIIGLVVVAALSSLTGARADFQEEIMEREVEETTLARGFRCCAIDAGFEEHADHCVEAITNIGGEARAMELCKTFHDRCVSTGCTPH